MNGLLEWILFLVLSGIAIFMAASMMITMSMYRAGLVLMASLVALAGLFILLDADLLAAIQIMMNVGGMMVMILFMVMIMMDPGGEMMTGMKRDMHMRGFGAFSMSMPRTPPPPEEHEPDQQKGAMDHEHHDMDMAEMSDMDMSDMNMSPRQNYDMMVDMAMSTAQLPWAIVLGCVSGVLLIALVVLTPWPLAHVNPTQDATNAVGELLLSRYMIAFEGAAFLILAGIAGAVILAKREHPKAQQQPAQAQNADTQMYTCPMHPEIRQQGLGNCPKCGMDLIPVKEKAKESSQHMTDMPHMQGGQP